MAKTREQKEKLVADYQQKLEKAKAVVLTDYSGLKNRPLFELKNKLSEKKIDYQVVKNSLLLRALGKEKVKIPSEILDRPLALAFSYDDEIEAAKIIHQFAGENERMEIVGGLQNGEFIEAEKIRTLALLPSRDELCSRLISSLNSPKLRFLNILTINQQKLIYLLARRQNG